MTENPPPPGEPQRPWRPPGDQPPPHPGVHGSGQGYGGLPSYGGTAQPGGDVYADPAAGLAGRLQRLAAAIIDYVIVGVVTNIIMLPFGNPVRVTTDNEIIWSAGAGGLTFLLGVAGFFYYVIMHWKFGQTLGKMLLKIRVVRDRDNGAISFGTALWRSLFHYLIAIFTCGIGAIVDVAWILWDPRRQALHDKVARTIVVRADTGRPNPYA